MKIISLHFPKTAGTSFRKTLEDNYKDKLLQDYTDLDINNIILNDYDIVHGHLIIDKYYNKLPNAKVITWLRNPIDRVISYYNFWNSMVEPKTDMGEGYRKFHQEKPTFIEFITKWVNIRDEFKIYTQNFNHKNFYFVGITEKYNEDINILAEKLKWNDVQYYNENITPKELIISKKDRKIFNDVYKEEIDIYNYFKKYSFFY